MSISERFAANTAALTSLEQTVNGSLTGLGDRVTDLEANTVTDAELATQLANRPTIAEMNVAVIRVAVIQAAVARQRLTL